MTISYRPCIGITIIALDDTPKEIKDPTFCKLELNTHNWKQKIKETDIGWQNILVNLNA